MYFQYDTNGIPFGFVYNNVQYFYLTNQMGDVIAVIDVNGYVIGEYVYDEWGNQSVHVTDDEDEYAAVTNANPLRYRGYCYDSETGYYYLQSRYYDPSICRFINADANDTLQQYKDTIIGLNLFSYCYNNPINESDKTGFGRTYVGFIVYSKPGSDFVKQANYMKKKIKKCSFVTFECKSAEDFVFAWNYLARRFCLKDLFLYVHGGTGTLYFDKSNILQSVNQTQNAQKSKAQKDHSFSELNNLSITGKIYLNSCNGGTSKTGVESVASILSKKVPAHSVRAVVGGSVYYRGITKPIVDGIPLTKEKGAYWADFNYHYVKRERKSVVCFIYVGRKWKYD